MQKQLRRWISIFVCGVMLWFGLGCQQQASGEVDNAQIMHILDRLSFGATPESIKEIQSRGIEAYIQAQLSPELISESSELNQYLAGLEDPKELLKRFTRDRQKQQEPGLSNQKIKNIEQELQNFRQKNRQQAIASNLARAVSSNRQLQAVMTNFWFNHFNVVMFKNDLDLWLLDYENEIRTRALGNFRDLLGMTARHPAMLIYLDNQFNTDPNSPAAKGMFKGLNENYARELMELHTLGVDGGYSQKDVETLARILTGWGIDRTNTRGDEKGFSFYPNRHDRSDKIFLGQNITGGGIEEGEKALDILATHPATAHFISYKLAQYFVADQPPSSLVDTLAQKFLDSNGNIKIVLDTLFHSQEFNDPQYYEQKFKTPYQYIVSLIRASEIKHPDFQRIHGMLSQLAMPVYGCLTPDGYKNTQDAWLNPDAMLRRISLATAIANGALDRDNPIDETTLQISMGSNFSAKTQAAINSSPPGLRKAIMLGSPEAMYH
jgi:uncharacterized protein (DUF1800 family)